MLAFFFFFIDLNQSGELKLSDWENFRFLKYFNLENFRAICGKKSGRMKKTRNKYRKIKKNKEDMMKKKKKKKGKKKKKKMKKKKKKKGC